MMKQFLVKLFKVSSFGIIIAIILFMSYLITDPFKVLYNYKSFTNLYVIPNRDHVSTVMFNQNRSKYDYDTFIFGSSRTLAYLPDQWKEYLPDNAQIYYFDASSELLYGIYTKLKFIESTGTKIENVLIILCRDHAFSDIKEYKSKLFIHHPITVGGSKLNYHNTFFKTYLSPKFLMGYYYYRITGKVSDRAVINQELLNYDSINNSFNFKSVMKTINEDEQKYYKSKEKEFYKRPKIERVDSISRINKEHHQMLLEIKQLFDKHHTNYKVVISPLYEEIKLHPKDKKILTSIFGQNLYDFSGKSEITSSKYNYFESSHYRPKVGKLILDSIYNGRKIE